MQVVKLHLGKKDAVLKQWIEYEKANDDNFSCAVVETLLYYIHTGTYLRIANIPKQKIKSLPDRNKSISFRENTEVHSWLLRKEANGEKVSTVIKRILKASITTADDEPLMLLISDEICTINDRRQHEIVDGVAHSYLEPVREPIYAVQKEALIPKNVVQALKIEDDEIHGQEVREELKPDEKDQAIQNDDAEAGEEARKPKKKRGWIDNLMGEGLNLS